MRRCFPEPLEIENSLYIADRYHQIFFSSLGETPRYASKAASLVNSAGMAIGMCLPKIEAGDGNGVFLPITPGAHRIIRRA